MNSVRSLKGQRWIQSMGQNLDFSMQENFLLMLQENEAIANEHILGSVLTIVGKWSDCLLILYF